MPEMPEQFQPTVRSQEGSPAIFKPPYKATEVALESEPSTPSALKDTLPSVEEIPLAPDAVGNELWIKRSNGDIQKATIDFNEKGEKVVTFPVDGGIGDEPFRADMVTPAAQQELELEYARRAVLGAYDDSLDNAIPYPKGALKPQVTFAPVTHIPNQVPADHEPFIDDTPARRITVIDPQGVQATKPKKRGWFSR